MKPTRLFIYPKDVQFITGKSYSYALNLFNTMRRKLNKEKNQAITVEEFCAFMGIEVGEVVAFLYG